MLWVSTWMERWIALGFIFAWAWGARPQFDTSTYMGLVLVPADAEVDSVIFRLRATDQDADFPLVFEITAAVQPIVRVANLPCTLYNKVCQANVILTRRLVPGRLHDFAVRVKDSKGDSNSMQATISVTNATTPRDMIFPHVPSIIMVPEDTKPGKELDYLLVRANPWHGKPVYIELWQPKELFTIRQRQTPTQTRGVITLVGELDFETQSMYTLTMYATDPYTEVGKDTRNIAGVHVVVIVQDVQDVPPVFTIAPPLTRVNNSVKPGDVILRVHAEDGDKGSPREVTYGLVSEGNPFTTFFNISEWTGEIILARPLDELTQITHVGAPILLSVVAEEVRRSREEPPGQATVVELGLLLGEPGNSPPYFDSDSYMAWMDENSPPGTVVVFDKPYLATVRDEDIGKTGVFALKLGNNNGTFEVTPTVAERIANFAVMVRDNTLMDYETRKTLEFTIIAQEVGPATNLSASVPVTIFLRDVNDNPPEFERETYEVTISENVSPGTRVIQVHAIDKDTGLSGSLRYTKLVGPGSETLTMDSETGLIIVAKGAAGLDREVTASLRLSVEARDENGRGLRSAVPLTVHLLDVNDNAPIFDKSIYEFVLNSDQTNFTSRAFIRAIDADAEPPNNEVRYELVQGNYGNKFHLDEVTGELILREPVNKSRRRRNNAYVHFSSQFRSNLLQTLNTFQNIGVSTEGPLRIWKNRKKRTAEDTLYTLTVRAYDLGVPHRSSTAKVHVMSATPMGALTLMLVVPTEHLDPVRTTETLAAITGGHVTIQEIRPYDQPGQPSNGAVHAGKMSILVARVEPTLSGMFLVDVDKIHKSLAANGMGIVPVVDSTTNSATNAFVNVSVGDSVGNAVGGGDTETGNVGKGGDTGVGTGGDRGGGSGAGSEGNRESASGPGGGTVGRTGDGTAGSVAGGSAGGTGGETVAGISEESGGSTGVIGGGTGAGNNGGTAGGTGVNTAGGVGGTSAGTSGRGSTGGTGAGTAGEIAGSTNVATTGGKGGGSVGGTAGTSSAGGTGSGIAGGGTAGGAGGEGASSSGTTAGGGTAGWTVGGTAGSSGEGGGTAGGNVAAIPGGLGGATAAGTGGGIAGTVDRGRDGGSGDGRESGRGKNEDTNFNESNKTATGLENEYIVYKAENKLLLWLLILLGLLMLLGLLALILCCICPGCPFYMAPRKRRIHSFETLTHPDARPKRHLRRKQLSAVKAEWSAKKQAWSADPLRRNWQFNRRNTKNRGLASLPGDVAQIGAVQTLRKVPSLTLRDGEPASWNVQHPTRKRKHDRLHVEDVEAGRTYDTEDVDSLRMHEMERGSDAPRQSYSNADETSRLPRDQHFYREGNAEVLRLVTRGDLGDDEVSPQRHRPTTLTSDHQVLGYRSDGKDILLRRFIEDQKIGQYQEVHASTQEIRVDGLDSRHPAVEHLAQRPEKEIILLPRNLEYDGRQHRDEVAPSVQRLIIDHGDIDEDALMDRRQQLEAQDANLRQQRQMAAAMLVGTAVSKATEKPLSKIGTLTVEQHGSSLNIPTYAIHDVELAKQNALLTQLLMDREARTLGVPGVDPGSYLETQSLPGQVAIATQTDRTTATQTDHYVQVRSRSDNDESEEEIRSRRKSKSKKRFGNEIRRSRSLLMKSPIQEESRSIAGTRRGLLRRNAIEAREGRRATLEPEVLREISDSLDERASTPSPNEARNQSTRLRAIKKTEYRSEVPADVDDRDTGELSEAPARSSPDVSKDKYHRRSHENAEIGDTSRGHRLGTSAKKQSSPAKSKTKSQKVEAKSLDGRKVIGKHGDRKDTDATSTDAKSHSTKGSTESRSNDGGTNGKKDTEERMKNKIKLISKSGILKPASVKSAKKKIFRETAGPLITKKRTMLRHQKATKVSTESSEFDEIPVKLKKPSLKAKLLKQVASITGSHLKQDSTNVKETSTLSDETKSPSSETTVSRMPDRNEQPADSTSSTGTVRQKTIKDKKKTPTSLKTQDTKEHGDHSKKKDDQRSVTAPSDSDTKSQQALIKSSNLAATKSSESQIEETLNKSKGFLKKTKSGVNVQENKSEIHGTEGVLKINAKAPDQPELELLRLDTETKKSSDDNSGKPQNSDNEQLLKIGTHTAENTENLKLASEASHPKLITLSIGPEPEPSTSETQKTTEHVLDSMKDATVTPTPEITETTTLVTEAESKSTNQEVLKATESNANDPHVPTSTINITAMENQAESNIRDKNFNGKDITANSDEVLPKKDSRVEEVKPTILSVEKQSVPSTKELSEGFLGSEILHTARDSGFAMKEDKPVRNEVNIFTDPVKTSVFTNIDEKQRKVEEKTDPSELATDKKDDTITETPAVSIGENDKVTSERRPKETSSPVDGSHEHPSSFVIIGKVEEQADTTPVIADSSIPRSDPESDKTKRHDLVEVRRDSTNVRSNGILATENENKSQKEPKDPEITSMTTTVDPLGRNHDSISGRNEMETDERRLPTQSKPTQGDLDRTASERKSSHTSDEENFPTTGSPSFYILSNTSASSAEGHAPNQDTLDTPIISDHALSENMAPDLRPTSLTQRKPSDKQSTRDTQGNLITGESQSMSLDLDDMRSGEWDGKQFRIAHISSDSSDNAQPYGTPRHRSKTGYTDADSNREIETLEEGKGDPRRSSLTLPPHGNTDSENIDSVFGSRNEISPGTIDRHLTPRLIAEEAIRSGLLEIISIPDTLKRHSSSQTPSNTSPENQDQQRETSKKKPAKETVLTSSTPPTKRSTWDKSGNASQFSKTIAETPTAVRRVGRPKTEPKRGNPPEGDPQPVRPRTQRGKTSDSGSVKPQDLSVRAPQRNPTVQRLKAQEGIRQGKTNKEETKVGQSEESTPKPDEEVKEGYMSRYKKKREEMERKRREQKEAAQEEQRPRWQRRPAVAPGQRIVGQESSKKGGITEGKTPEGATPRSRRKIKPLENAESEQLRAIVKEGRKLRRAEGGDSDDPPVEIFATEPPARSSATSRPPPERLAHKYERIPAPFYLHPPPPPPPHSSPQVSPLHATSLQETRRPDDDLDSGIAVSLQGGTKLRHQQLLEKKSVFDIAYSEAAPSQLRTDSTTPPS